MRRGAPFTLLLACATAPNVPNTLIGATCTSGAPAVPREAIFVRARQGMYKVWLDTGERTRVSANGYGNPGTTTRAGIAIHVEDRHYVIEHDGSRQVVADVAATARAIALSPDQARFAVVEEPCGSTPRCVTVVTIADASYKRYDIPRDSWLEDWTPHGEPRIYGKDSGWHAIDHATGTLGPSVSPNEDPPPTTSTHTLDCGDTRGLQLARRDTSDRQELWIEPEPRHAPPFEPYRIVRATNHPDHNTLELRTSGPEPGRLGDAFFTHSCTHVVFTLGDSVYVTPVRGGCNTHVTVGSDPQPADVLPTRTRAPSSAGASSAR